MQLNEITQWNVEVKNQGSKITFYPTEQKEYDAETQFRVLLFYNEDNDSWTLKFGNTGAEDPDDRFKWSENDPDRLKKILFIKNVVQKYIIPLIDEGKLNKITYSPYEDDNKQDERVKLFNNIFKQSNKDNKYKIYYDDGLYFVERNIKDFDLKEYLIKHKLTRNSKL